VLAVQIFDQKKFKKKDQGFLGVVNVRIGNVIDLDAGGDGMPTILQSDCVFMRPRAILQLALISLIYFGNLNAEAAGVFERIRSE
jgi:hypothetical protein